MACHFAEIRHRHGHPDRLVGVEDGAGDLLHHADATSPSLDSAEGKLLRRRSRRRTRSPARAPRGARAGPRLLAQDERTTSRHGWRAAGPLSSLTCSSASRMSTPARSCSPCPLHASASKRTRSAFAGLSVLVGDLVEQLERPLEVSHGLGSAVRTGRQSSAHGGAEGLRAGRGRSTEWKANSPSSVHPGVVPQPRLRGGGQARMRPGALTRQEVVVDGLAQKAVPEVEMSSGDAQDVGVDAPRAGRRRGCPRRSPEDLGPAAEDPSRLPPTEASRSRSRVGPLKARRPGPTAGRSADRGGPPARPAAALRRTAGCPHQRASSNPARAGSETPRARLDDARGCRPGRGVAGRSAVRPRCDRARQALAGTGASW